MSLKKNANRNENRQNINGTQTIIKNIQYNNESQSFFALQQKSILGGDGHFQNFLDKQSLATEFYLRTGH